MTKLKDVCKLIVDCPHSTARDEGEGYPLIRTPNIGKGRFNLEGVHRVSQSVYEKRTQRAIPQDKVILIDQSSNYGIRYSATSLLKSIHQKRRIALGIHMLPNATEVSGKPLLRQVC